VGGRDNHERVIHVRAELHRLGISVWLDEERMDGSLEEAMAKGIEGASAFVVFVTSAYVDKVAGTGPNGANDNCKFEFDHARIKLGVEKMIAVVMEKSCLDPRTWHGTICGRLGGRLYIDLTSDDPEHLQRGIAQLAESVAARAPPAGIQSAPRHVPEAPRGAGGQTGMPASDRLASHRADAAGEHGDGRGVDGALERTGSSVWAIFCGGGDDEQLEREKSLLEEDAIITDASQLYKPRPAELWSWVWHSNTSRAAGLIHLCGVVRGDDGDPAPIDVVAYMLAGAPGGRKRQPAARAAGGRGAEQWRIGESG
jgi:hypothetical protein